MRTFLLKKDLPGLPSGRVFRTTIDMKHVFVSMSDEERIYNKDLHSYDFPIEIVEKNTDWFEETTDPKVIMASKTYSLDVVRKAFETFRYVGFPHNNPTWEEWSKENLQ